jgi:hypothetical protein
MPSPRSFSVAKVLQVALSIVLGSSLWPLLCQTVGAYGEPGAIHDVAVTSSLISGAVGGFIGCAVAWTFARRRAPAASPVAVNAAGDQVALQHTQG